MIWIEDFKMKELFIYLMYTKEIFYNKGFFDCLAL